jgi:DNA polymerase-3 subunit delta'
MDYALVHNLIQSASGARNAQNFARLCDLTEERIEKFAKQALKNLPGAKPAAAWSQLWQTVHQRRLETETLNLDKGAFLMSVFSDMERVYKSNR